MIPLCSVLWCNAHYPNQCLCILLSLLGVALSSVVLCVVQMLFAFCLVRLCTLDVYCLSVALQVAAARNTHSHMGGFYVLGYLALLYCALLSTLTLSAPFASVCRNCWKRAEVLMRQQHVFAGRRHKKRNTLSRPRTLRPAGTASSVEPLQA